MRTIRILAGRLDHRAGSHVYHVELARRLANRGHRISVVCFETAPEVESVADVTVVPRSHYRDTRLWWRFDAWLAYLEIKARFSRVALDQPDVVIGGEHLLLRSHCKRFAATPWIYLPHSLVTDLEIANYKLEAISAFATKHLYRRIQKWALRSADCTLRFTHRACDVLKGYYQLRKSPRFVVNPVGVDLPEQREATPSSVVRLLMVGRVTEAKGCDIAIEALSKMSAAAWRLDVVGEGGFLEEMRSMAAAGGLSARVHFHGFQSDPSRWYRDADLLLFPSRSESLGLVVLEAMSHGVPCLAIRHDGREFHNVNEELIWDGEDGLLADGASGFAQRLAEALQQPGMLRQLGKNARERVKRDFTWDAHLDRYEALFDELVLNRSKDKAVLARR